MPKGNSPLSAAKAPFIWLVLVLGASCFLASPAIFSQNRISMCVDCHTDAQKIKSLYTPPDVEIKVEEGEG